ncbi:HTH-type transcriptional regulator Mce2R [compost metagenome]
MVSAAPDRRLNLAQQLVLDLSRKILAGELPAGTKLPTEQVITQERGVSRTVVREALSRLQAEGLVET